MTVRLCLLPFFLESTFLNRVPCDLTVEAEKTTVAPAVTLKKPSRGPSDDDVFQAYMNRGGSYKWNEHQYFVKAIDDLSRVHQDKMAKVSSELILLVCLSKREQSSL